MPCGDVATHDRYPSDTIDTPTTWHPAPAPAEASVPRSKRSLSLRNRGQPPCVRLCGVTTECESQAAWWIGVRLVGRWCVAVVVAVAEFVTGGASIGTDGAVDLPRRKQFGYLFTNSSSSAFEQRARKHGAWSGGKCFRLGRAEHYALISRTGWVAGPVVVGSARRWLLWTFQAVCVDGERLTLAARHTTAASWNR